MNNTDYSNLLEDAEVVETVDFTSSSKKNVKDWEDGITQFRFVPFPARANIKNPNSPVKLTEKVHLKLHYAKDPDGNILETFVCPKNYGESCPMCELGWTIYNERKKVGKEKENDNLWKKYLPSDSYIFYGFERGLESEMVQNGKFTLEAVKFSKKPHDALEKMKKDPDVGAYMSFSNGIDIRVTYSAEDAKNRSLSISLKEAKSRSPVLSSEFLNNVTVDKNGNCSVSDEDMATIKSFMSASYQSMTPVQDLFAIIDESKILDLLDKMDPNSRMATEVEFKGLSGNKLAAAAAANGMAFEDDDDIPF